MAQNKAKLRQVLRSALPNKKKADELIDVLLELQTKMDAILAKLDADTGVADSNFVSTLGLKKKVED